VEVLLHEQITEKVIGAAIEVHGTLGPGLLESAYEECLAHEFKLRAIAFERQVALPIPYKGILLDCGYRIDFVVEVALVVELKSVEKIIPVHEAQLMTHLRLSRKRVGLLLNFNTVLLRDGIVRRVL
jgi:GxxExxY protein